VASLLEVGTGFHPELTGRENVFLNGAILGMTRDEIKRKFDEIIAFAEIEKFVDTPVKRYSSGMYVRLAFAVAAHLEPEILIIDEVLAVGDTQFQKKCLGKMGEVSREGRTVLFVSHQLGMISQLCSHVLLLENGRLSREGGAKDMIAHYLERQMTNQQRRLTRVISPESGMHITDVQSLSSSSVTTSEFAHTESVTLSIKFDINKPVEGVFLAVTVTDPQRRKIFTSEIELDSHIVGMRTGPYAASMTIPAKFLAPGHYYASLALHVPKVEFVDQLEDALNFSIVDVGSEFAIYGDIDYGCVLVDCSWELQAAKTLPLSTAVH
jgi:lipopolysaccharide transport system ATP-binding protein